jgi:DNA-binding MarR family transcriptional regulator
MGSIVLPPMDRGQCLSALGSRAIGPQPIVSGPFAPWVQGTTAGKPASKQKRSAGGTRDGCVIEPIKLYYRTMSQVEVQVVGDALALQEEMMALVRAFGLHQPDRTPCGEPIPVSEAHTLAALAGNAPLTQQELGHRLRLEKSTVSRLVRQVEARGWVTRSGDDRDGRVVRLALTEQGQQVAGELANARAAKFTRLIGAIPEEQRAAVLSSLRVLVEAMHEQP